MNENVEYDSRGSNVRRLRRRSPPTSSTMSARTIPIARTLVMRLPTEKVIW
jgi:hypothetical protein